jgi:GntR family transcriptional repressor for pyruvate dehydrogenase complex
MNAFTPVRSRRVYTQIVEQIVDLIKGGEFPVGRQLPTERDLARRLGVGRASVREALSALQILGLVETKHGQGTFVCAKEESPVLQTEASWIYSEESPFDIIHARLTIEPSIAALAARRRSETAVKHMEELLERVQADLYGMYVFSEGDRDFHSAIAEATGNSVIAAVMSGIRELMGQKMWRTLMTDTSFATPGRLQQGMGEHREIVEAIRLGNSELAAERMTRHLQRVEQVMAEAELFEKGQGMGAADGAAVRDVSLIA